MSSNCILLILIIFLCKSRMLETQTYSQYKITTFNYNERLVLYKLNVFLDELIFLNGVTNDASLPIDIIMKDSYSKDFENLIETNDIEYYKVEDNFYYSSTNESLADEAMQIIADEANIAAEFLPYNFLTDWASNMCKKHGRLKKEVIGKTFEQRDIFVLKLSSSNMVGKKPAVFILGGEQGRDWMTPAIIINFIEIITEKDTSLSELFDFYFLPVLNPDGYDFTMEEDRFWDKNRRIFYPAKFCHLNRPAIGVNIDRNFFFAEKSSSHECDAVHPGQDSLSEKESISLAAFLNTIAYDMMAFINIRGYENLITLPYANPKMTSNNHELVYEILANSVRKANRIFNKTIKVDTTARCFFNVSGNIPDWVKSNLNTPIVYTEFISIENECLPCVKDIVPLTSQFQFILNDTLLLANKMYRPLFNQQVTAAGNHILLLFCGITSVLIKLYM